MPLFCSQCGTTVEATDRFCASCGATTGAAHQPTAPPAAPPPPPPVAAAPILHPPTPANVLPPPTAPPVYQPPAHIPPPPPGYHQAAQRSKPVWPIILGVIGGLALLIVIIVALWPGPDPKDAVLQIRNSFANRDLDTFKEYVDEDSVMGDALDQTAISVARASTANSGAVTQNITIVVAQATVDSLKPQIVPEMTSSLDQFVSAGNVNSSDANGDSSAGGQFVMQVMRGILNTELNYEDCTVISKDGDEAQVAVDVKTPLKDDPLIVQLSMRKQDGRWRVEKILNIANLVSQIEPQQ